MPTFLMLEYGFLSDPCQEAKKRCVVGSMLSERVYARPYELRVREVLSGIQCAHVVLM